MISKMKLAELRQIYSVFPDLDNVFDTIEALYKENERLKQTILKVDVDRSAMIESLSKHEAVAKVAQFAIRAYEWPLEDDLRACGQGCDGDKTHGHDSDCPFPPLAKALSALEGK